VNSFSSFSSGGDDARPFRSGATREEKEVGGVVGDIISSSSNSGDDRSTSGEGDNSLLRSASASSDLEVVLDRGGEMVGRCAKWLFEGSGMG
jgi:hypothetical protein